MLSAITNLPAWIGIVFCISQSAMFSGLNLAFFSLNRLHLEAEVESGDKRAPKVLNKRRDANFLLATILWGNVGINVLLTLLSDSLMAGISAFIFSTVVITFAGEIIPQAYFSRHALRMASALSPVISFYQFLLYPVAKPAALLLDYFLGQEGIMYFRESSLREIIKKHIEADESDIDRFEGMGALNFLEIDDLHVINEGEEVDPQSIIAFPSENGRLVVPEYNQRPDDPFLQRVHASQKKWVILTDTSGQPRLALDADEFLRAALLDPEQVSIFSYCHRPLVVQDKSVSMGEVIGQLQAWKKQGSDNIIENDIVLLWGEHKKVITGADILGRLLEGIRASG